MDDINAAIDAVSSRVPGGSQDTAPTQDSPPAPAPQASPAPRGSEPQGQVPPQAPQNGQQQQVAQQQQSPSEPKPAGTLADLVRQRQRAQRAEQEAATLRQQYQELSEWRKQWEPFVQQYNQVQQQPPGQQPAGVQDLLARQFKQYDTRLAEMSKALEEQRVVAIQSQIESQMKELRGRFPSMREYEVLAVYEQHPDMDLETIAKTSHEEMSTLREAAVKEYLEKKTSDRTPRPMGRGGTPPAPAAKRFKDLDEASNAAAEYLDHALGNG